MSIFSDILSAITTKGRKLQIKMGLAKDFNDSKLDVGELGLILDKDEVRIGLADGSTKKVGGVDLSDIPLASITQDGIMSKSMASKLSGIASGANFIQVVDNLTSTSTVQALSAKQGNELKKMIDNIDASGGTVSIVDASTTQKGIVQLTDSVSSTSISTSATPNSVKQAYDLANSIDNRLSRASIYIGQSSEATSGGVAIAYQSFANGSSAIAIGNSARAEAAHSLAIGGQTSCTARGIALGSESSNIGTYSSAIGLKASAINNNQGVLGSNETNSTRIWTVPGSFSVSGTKNFEIPHPNPIKKDSHVIRHGAVESPTAGDTLYRYTVEAYHDNEIIEVILPDYFKYLNTNVDVWVNPYKHFGRAYGEVIEDTLYVTCEKTGTYKCLIIGTRNDEHESVQNWQLKGVEREIGESWTGETYVFEIDELKEEIEFMEEY